MFLRNNQQNTPPNLFFPYTRFEHNSLTPDDLANCIISEFPRIITNYERILKDYNFGVMMKEYNKFEDDLGQFKVEAQELINKVSRLFSRQYKESLTAERRSLWTLRIAFIGVLLTAIFFIISTYCCGFH